MTKRLLDPTTLARLGDLSGRVELCDEFGHTIGYFLPVCSPEEYRGVDAPISREELSRREREDKHYSTAEVLERLRNI